MRSPATRDRVLADVTKGNAIVKGTPTFVLDGQVLPNLPNLEWFVDYIDRKLAQPSQQVRSRALALILLSFLGLVDTLYLGIKRGKPVPCTITTGCEEVLNSRFSAIGGNPHLLVWIRVLPGGLQRCGLSRFSVTTIDC